MAHIAIVVPGHWLTGKGGSEFQAHLLADHIVEKTDHAVTYIGRNLSGIAGSLSYEVRSLDPVFADFRYGLFWDAIRLYRTLEAIKPDVIIQRLASAYTGVAALYSKRNDIPLFWCIASDRDVDPLTSLVGRSPGRAIDRAVFRFGLRNSSHIIAQTNDQALALKDNYDSLATAVIPNCHPKAVGPFTKDQNFTVLWVANIKTLKQPEEFIRLARAFDNDSNIRFKMIGGAEDSPWGAAILEKINESRNIEYLGELDNEQVNDELGRSRLLVNTSLYEGLSNTFIQAWQRNVPVLSLNVDPDSHLSEKGFGMVAGTSEKLREHLSFLVDNPQVLRQMAESAKEYADVHYSMHNADRLLSLVEEAISVPN